jgi:hypothetical protein
VTVAIPQGTTLADVRQQIKEAQDELQELRRVPTPAADIEQRVQRCVEKLGSVTVSGIGEGEELRMKHSGDALALMAALFPDETVKLAMAEVERTANTPLPVKERRERMAELKQEIIELQHIEEALVVAGHGERAPDDAPPEAILGCRVVKGRSREKAA